MIDPFNLFPQIGSNELKDTNGPSTAYAATMNSIHQPILLDDEASIMSQITYEEAASYKAENISLKKSLLVMDDLKNQVMTLNRMMDQNNMTDPPVPSSVPVPSASDRGENRNASLKSGSDCSG